LQYHRNSEISAAKTVFIVRYQAMLCGAANLVWGQVVGSDRINTLCGQRHGRITIRPDRLLVGHQTRHCPQIRGGILDDTLKQKNLRRHVYIDAIAGWGIYISKATGEFVLGSPINALNVDPPFSEYHFIDDTYRSR
jgi:hypothetical protein